MVGETVHVGERPQHRRLVRERGRGPGARLLDDICRSVARGRHEDRVAARGVDDRQVLLENGPWLDKTEREEIVGYACLLEHCTRPSPSLSGSRYARQARTTKGALVPLTDHVAIISLTSDISMRNVLQAAAAVQKQITRDFVPFWGLQATVDVFEDLESVPSDYYPVVLFGDPDELVGRLEFAVGREYAEQLIDDFERDQMAGLHLNAFTRQPFALVEVNDAWSVVLSHEVLELIADPYGNRLVAAAKPGDPDRRVKYLLEICDPCQTMWYPVNGVPVADFYTQRYFDPVDVEQTRFSFTGALEGPLQILPGGYLSWIDPADSGLYRLDAGQREPELIADLSTPGHQHGAAAHDRRHERGDATGHWGVADAGAQGVLGAGLVRRRGRGLAWLRPAHG